MTGTVSDTMLSVMLCDEDNISVAYASILHVYRKNGLECNITCFNAAWEACIGEVKEKEPETWTLDQVFERLDQLGWIVLRPKYLEVSY
jgi:hypothetical protein